MAKLFAIVLLQKQRRRRKKETSWCGVRYTADEEYLWDRSCGEQNDPLFLNKKIKKKKGKKVCYVIAFQLQYWKILLSQSVT
ncbi:unnamed protein product [Coffea canephora]|uniref:Uncharacterized protein n=1 Tax=Coffea canephora TaxID=49390 RepID=A0A068UQT7_COFCA|nr:unnamed protein product [Coffea canephora]